MRKIFNFFSTLALLIFFLTGCNFGGSTGEDSENSYTVTWNNYDGTTLEIDNNVLEGSMPSYDGETPTRNDSEQYEYTFDKWSPDLVEVTSNVTYTATYKSTITNAKVTFDLNGGESPSYVEYKYMDSITADNFFFDVTKQDSNFRGWSYNGTKIFDEKGNQLANPTISESMTFEAMFAQTAKMTIVTNLEGAGVITGEGEYPYNSYIDISAYANENYVFIGWYLQDTLLSHDNAYKYMLWSEDVTLEARFEIVSFLLNIHSNNEDYGLVLLKSTFTNEYLQEYQEYIKYTSQVTIAANSKTDVRFLGWYDNENKLVETNAVYSFVMPNHDYTLEAKWNYFTVDYVLNGGTNELSNPTSYTIDSGRITLNNPTRTGYDFTGWTYNGETVTEIDPNWIDNIILIANWTAQLNNLSVTSEDTSKGTVAITSGSGYSGESITVVATPADDYAFKGWYHESTKVSDDVTYTFIMPTNNYSIVAHFFTKAEMCRLGITPTLSEDGKTITYGLYPQTNVNDSTLISSLNSLTIPESNGWYLYDGDYYAKVSATPYDSSYIFDNGITINSGTTYWFKCEPIVWDILSNTSGTYYIVSSVLLDAHCYYNSILDRIIDDQIVYANNYKYSDIRTWLNEDFYNSAFALGNEYIQVTTVDNSSSTIDDRNKYACDNTEDKVFLPSYQDYCNRSYGFSVDESRCCKTTDWARARSAQYNTKSSHLYNGDYWTRSPYSNSSLTAKNVYYDGFIASHYVDSAYCSVRPALSIKIA